MSNFVSLKTAELSGAALVYAWKQAFGLVSKSTRANLDLLPAFARFSVASVLGETVNVPKELCHE